MSTKKLLPTYHGDGDQDECVDDWHKLHEERVEVASVETKKPAVKESFLKDSGIDYFLNGFLKAQP
jgi:hypothetical protein